LLFELLSILIPREALPIIVLFVKELFEELDTDMPWLVLLFTIFPEKLLPELPMRNMRVLVILLPVTVLFDEDPVKDKPPLPPLPTRLLPDIILLDEDERSILESVVLVKVLLLIILLDEDERLMPAAPGPASPESDIILLVIVLFDDEEFKAIEM
jgi:hypothetical protein